MGGTSECFRKMPGVPFTKTSCDAVLRIRIRTIKAEPEPCKHLSDKKLSNLFFNLEKMTLHFFFFHTVRANAFIFKFLFCFLS